MWGCCGRETDEHRLRFELDGKGFAYLGLHQVLQLQQIGGSSASAVHQRQRMFARDSYASELKAPAHARVLHQPSRRKLYASIAGLETRNPETTLLS